MLAMEDENIRVPVPRAEGFAAQVLTAVGIPHEDAAAIAALMIQADVLGADGHGIFRLAHYVARIRGGAVNLTPAIRVRRQKRATALVDGDNGFGHLVMEFAAQLAIEKASTYGVAWVGAYNSNHAGAGALYSRMGLRHGMVGIYGAVASGNAMPAWGGVDLLLGTNPISIAIPSAGRAPVVLDMATTVASHGKVKVAALNGAPIPEGWVTGWDGEPITDPQRAGEGFLAPLGGPKGYGLSLVVGLLAGSLNGAAMGGEVVNFNKDLESATNTGHFICMLALDSFGDVSEITERVEHVTEELRASKLRNGYDRVRVPGDESSRKEAVNRELGIPVAVPLQFQLNALADELGVERLIL